MTDIDELIASCVAAVAAPDSQLAVRDVVDRALADPTLADRLPATKAGLNVLYNAPDLTVLNVIWPPHMSLFPHDHRMWAVIGIYGGREDNAFYRRDGASIVASGGKQLFAGDVLMLGDQTIHAVDNPARAYTGALHIYGGDFIEKPRSQWDPERLEEAPWDLAAVQQEFARAEQAYAASEK
jgi:predicted metal-dependent enzyme (double-stranded beta helix superfamily)